MLVLYLFFVSQILLTTSMRTMLRLLPQIGLFCGSGANDIDASAPSTVATTTALAIPAADDTTNPHMLPLESTSISPIAVVPVHRYRASITSLFHQRSEQRRGDRRNELSEVACRHSKRGRGRGHICSDGCCNGQCTTRHELPRRRARDDFLHLIDDDA